MAFERLFVVEHRFGVCVGLSLPETDLSLDDLGDDPGELGAALHPAEAAFARALSPARRAGWLGGRLALRAALAAVGAEPGSPILSTPRGAPILPPGAVGSVSHKRTIAVALAARERTPRATLGIDVEQRRPLRTDIASRVLTPDERAVLPPDGPAREAAVLLRFSAKEAIYKALDPWAQRFVGFHEAIVGRAADGSLTARLALSADDGPFTVELDELRGAGPDDLILIAARVARQGP